MWNKYKTCALGMVWLDGGSVYDFDAYINVLFTYMALRRVKCVTHKTVETLWNRWIYGYSKRKMLFSF